MGIKELGKSLLGKAPAIAAALGGPGGMIASVALSALSKAVLGHDKGTADEIGPLLSALTPEQSAELYKADKALQAELARIDLRRDELVIEDRNSARNREANYLQAGKRDVRGDVLAFGAISALAVSIGLAFFVELTQDQQLLVAGLIGSLTVIVKDVYSHHFGSSRGSENKTAMLEARK